MARFYPWRNDSWYLKAGAGYVSHWVAHLGETDRKSATGGMIGAGYDFVINQRWDHRVYKLQQAAVSVTRTMML